MNGRIRWFWVIGRQRTLGEPQAFSIGVYVSEALLGPREAGMDRTHSKTWIQHDIHRMSGTKATGDAKRISCQKPSGNRRLVSVDFLFPVHILGAILENPSAQQVYFQDKQAIIVDRMKQKVLRASSAQFQQQEPENSISLLC